MWNAILDVISRIVSPDWGALIGLIPIALAAAVVLYLLFLLRRAFSAPPRRRLPTPTAPPPAGTHVPGPSFAPILAALGAASMFLSLLFVSIGPKIDPATKQPIPDSTTWSVHPFGVLALVIGICGLVGGLLYWGREANRDYDALEPPAPLPAVVHRGPPPGVHMPGPSFRPFLFAISATVLMLGQVIHPAIMLGGLVMLFVALLGWLRDARLEYREVERADETGHLESIAAPQFPTRTLGSFLAIFVLSALVAGGILPPQGAGVAASGSAAPSAASSQKPGPSSAAAGSGASTAAAGSPAAGGGSPSGVILLVTASGVSYDTASLSAPAGKAFQITFTNNDAGIPHNISIHQGSPTGPEVWKGEIFSGVATKTYDVPALPAGTYGFVCTVHPNMTGTLTVQ